MRDFELQTHAQRVVFGAGAASSHLAREVEMLGGTRVLLVAAAAEADLAERLSVDLPVAGAFSEVRMHVPVSAAEAARRRAHEVEADLLLCIGGGSTTGTAKAVALTSGLPVLAVPTTYAGSEATPVWGLTEGGRKTTGTDARVLPRTVVYDPGLTASLPVALTVASGLNALAHCVDSLWAPRANPVSTALGLEGARALGRGLVAVAGRGDEDGRPDCLYGAYLAAVAFAGAGSGLHHKICHVLGGAYDLPHAPTHAVVLPHVVAHNAGAVPEAAGRLARALGEDAALGADEALESLLALYDAVDAPRSLADLGMREEDLAEAAGLVAEAVPADNPRPLPAPGAEQLLRRAWVGDRPVPTRAIREGAQR